MRAHAVPRRQRASSLLAGVGALVAVGAAAPARAEIGWSGAVRLGVGGALTGARAGQGNIDLGVRLDVIARKGDYDVGWGGGPFFDARTLAFTRHDVGGGATVSTPVYYNLFAANLRVGVGYRWRSDADNAALLMTTFTFGFRIPVKAHEEVVLGVYTDARVLFAGGVPTELTTGIEVDPVGIIAAVYERVKWQPR
jgi:hypothetical protein